MGCNRLVERPGKSRPRLSGHRRRNFGAGADDAVAAEAAALRENLRKRKEQARARSEPDTPEPAPP